MKFCQYLLKTFKDIFETIEIEYTSRCPRVQSPSRVLYGQKLAGYVHRLEDDNGVFISDSLEAYLIREEMMTKYELETGDFIRARVGYDKDFAAVVVTDIDEIKKIDYDTTKHVKATRAFPIRNHQMRYGTSAMIPVEDGYFAIDVLDELFMELPSTADVVVLSVDGRKENFEQNELFVAPPALSPREKLIVCLRAFFRAKELAKSGKDIILVVDSAEKMLTVFSNCLIKSEAFEANFVAWAAIMDFEGIMSSSACLNSGGTLSIITLQHNCMPVIKNYPNERYRQLFEVIL